MKFISPLRYPGGKNKLAKFVASVCEKNNIDGLNVEPYAGGASVALHLLLNGHVRDITINDFDRSIYAFWYSVLNNTEKLCQKIEETDVTLESWEEQKKIQLNKESARLLDLGFSTLFLNRTNYSGIINGGMIGGRKQKGKYKIDCRFNKKDIIERIRLIASFKKNIHLFNLDALALIEKIEKELKDEHVIFYFDPPYYLKGQSLYMNAYEPNDHEKVSERIKRIKNAEWIVSYDNTPQIVKLYTGFRKKMFSLVHTAYEGGEGKEIIFFSKNLDVSGLSSLKNL